MRFQQNIIGCFSLADFKNFSLTFIYFKYVPWFVFGFILFENSLGFLDLYTCFLLQIRQIFTPYFFPLVFWPLLYFFSFWDLYNLNIIGLLLSKISLNLSSFKKKIFLFFFLSFFSPCSVWVSSSALFSSSLIQSLASSSQLLNPPPPVYFYSSVVFFSSIISLCSRFPM